MNPRDIKRRANAIRKAMTGEAYYDRKYKDLRVADLLIVLEDDNWEEAKDLADLLLDLNEWADNENLLVLSNNNGMGYTIKEYEKGD